MAIQSVKPRSLISFHLAGINRFVLVDIKPTELTAIMRLNTLIRVGMIRPNITFTYLDHKDAPIFE